MATLSLLLPGAGSTIAASAICAVSCAVVGAVATTLALKVHARTPP